MLKTGGICVQNGAHFVPQTGCVLSPGGVDFGPRVAPGVRPGAAWGSPPVTGHVHSPGLVVPDPSRVLLEAQGHRGFLALRGVGGAECRGFWRCVVWVVRGAAPPRGAPCLVAIGAPGQ